VVTVLLNTLAVVLVVAILGLAPFKFSVVALVPVMLALPIVIVPVLAPMFNDVAAPAKFTVVAVVFTRGKLVEFVVIPLLLLTATTPVLVKLFTFSLLITMVLPTVVSELASSANSLDIVIPGSWIFACIYA
jgi:hypothetical protein